MRDLQRCLSWIPRQPLYIFDAEGNLRQSTKLSGTVGDLNDGQVALANGNVYVTLGTPTNAVVAFGQNDLLPVSLPSLAFHGLSVPRGIVFDSKLGVLRRPWCLDGDCLRHVRQRAFDSAFLQRVWT